MKKISFLRSMFLMALMMGLVTILSAQDLKINYFRAPDQSGVNVFETSKDDVVPFEGMKVRLGGNFAQQYQGLSHSNTLAYDSETGNELNRLNVLSPGFNLATANLNVDAQLGDGIRLNLVTYLSSRHHTEAWVKGGYIQFDKLPLGIDAIDEIMKYVTIKVGHMEINYGDGHFRRSDNGNAIYNPFVGNYIMDAFDTQIGGEVYFQSNGFLLMAGMTNGELKGDIKNSSYTDPYTDEKVEGKMAPALMAKIGYDSELSSNVRVRLTGSIYHTEKSVANHLYDGDRTGARYYGVMIADGSGDNFRSGRFAPGFKSKVTAIMVNPFVKVGGLEVFGLLEKSTGGTAAEADADALRTWNQAAGEVIYRFTQNENLYIGGRYNKVWEGVETNPQAIERIQVGAGWFVTPNVLLKGEWMNQTYTNFDATSVYADGKFGGVVIEAVVGF